MRIPVSASDLDIVILLLNGPPSSGKDEVAKVVRKLRFNMDRFSMPLKALIPALLGTTHEVLEKYKDTPIPETICPGGYTYRQLQISASENWLKPLFGKAIFGQLLATRIVADVGGRVPRPGIPFRYVIPDSGFIEEFAGLHQGLHRHGIRYSMLVCRLSRPGYDFSEDSRDYLDAMAMEEISETFFLQSLKNEGTLFDLEADVNQRVMSWLQYLDDRWAVGAS